jgi:hypothetical protein
MFSVPAGALPTAFRRPFCLSCEKGASLAPFTSLLGVAANSYGMPKSHQSLIRNRQAAISLWQAIDTNGDYFNDAMQGTWTYDAASSAVTVNVGNKNGSNTCNFSADRTVAGQIGLKPIE